jgi:hypothetical protein
MNRGWSSFIVAIVVWLAASRSAHAQLVPQTLTFSARIDEGGGPTAGGKDLDFAIYTASGALLWSESHPGVIVQNGRADVLLGSVIPLGNVFDTTELLKLEVTVDGYVMSPRMDITSVPYAQRAAVAYDAQKLGGLTASQFLPKGTTLSCTGTNKVIGLTASGNVSCGADLGGGTTYTAGSGLELTNGTQFAIAALGVVTSHLADGAVTLAKLAGNSVNSARIVDGSIAGVDIAADAIGMDQAALPASVSGTFTTTTGPGGNYLFPLPALVPTSSGRCMVMVNTLINSAPGPYTITVATRVNGGAPQNDVTTRVTFEPPTGFSFANATTGGLIPVAPGSSVEFGCFIATPAAGITINCTTSYLCT